ncbi:hypothetical protein L0V05_10130 [Tabrizicola sp. J26]|uniref:hypothetical protein n=1 Tax=Alitabrizicola rongguiensis TaxID=2909234 RepID=UPI001F3C8F4A|nr:hypothetical protein [Tabrizicola rongguiensis]MCF1709174.1 hypothetical protein [Tabrizicola rongguiensis]
MAHDWIFDVLADLRLYALSNDMPGLAGKVEEAMRIARRELATTRRPDREEEDGEVQPHRSRPN